MNILGLNAYHADVSAVLVRNGQLVAAVEEERFRRIKHVAGFPAEAIRVCLEMGGVSADEIDHFAVSRDPRAHLWRKAWFALRRRPGLDMVRRRLKNQGQVGGLPGTIAERLDLKESDVKQRLHWVEHHPAHLASSFFLSPFEDAAVCAIDGFGDFVSTSLAQGRGNRLEILRRVFFPHSLGELYLAVTQFLGFPNYGDEFKVMGLAPYGNPDFVPQLRSLVNLKDDGGFELDLSYFQHWSRGDSMTFEGGRPNIGPVYSPRLEELLGPARRPDDDLETRHEAIAASLQVVFEEAAFHVLRGLHQATGAERLCLAGGCAMNSVANGKIREKTPFREVYVQPAAADNGTALGAAYWVWNQVLGRDRGFRMNHALWGPAFDDGQIGEALDKLDSERKRFSLQRIHDQKQLCRRTARALTEGQVVGWFQGRMEWGARALGNRSILADPRRRDMREIINTKIKFRERFRPFAPAVLEERLDDYFEGAVVDPFMIQVYPVRPDKREVIPAVTHVDGSGRLQTVGRADNPVFWQLIREFEELTGVPVLLNTSFNENEPIVHRFHEALDCFLRTDMDLLVAGSFILEKRQEASSVDSRREPRAKSGSESETEQTVRPGAKPSKP